MNTYFEATSQCKKMLSNLDKWLDAAVEYAAKKKFEPQTLLGLRLAPDQYAFVRQVQAACDSGKFLAARLSGKPAPAHPDTEATVAELKARIASVVTYLEGFKEEDFKGAEARMVPLNFMPGKGLSGNDYLMEMALPNFYFHVTTAYAILRHNGLDLGKIQFIGSLNLKDV